MLRKIDFITRNIYFVLFIHILIILYVFWPGLMSRDSFIQYSQANSGYYQDWHPPIMALVWRIILLIFPFQTGMLILQCLLLFIGLSILIKNTKTSIGRYLFLAMPFYPWIFGISGVIWKDIQLAFTLLITTRERRERGAPRHDDDDGDDDDDDARARAQCRKSMPR